MNMGMNTQNVFADRPYGKGADVPEVTPLSALRQGWEHDRDAAGKELHLLVENFDLEQALFDRRRLELRLTVDGYNAALEASDPQEKAQPQKVPGLGTVIPDFRPGR